MLDLSTHGRKWTRGLQRVGDSRSGRSLSAVGSLAPSLDGRRLHRPHRMGFCGRFRGGSGSRTPSAHCAERRIPESLSFAHGLFRQRKFDLAADEYQRFLESRPSPADANDARFGLASARLFQGRYKEARRAFQDFLEKAPDHPRARTARYRLGELSYILGDLPEARKSLESFLADSAKHPNQETAWTYLGDVCFGLDDLPAARTAYERSLADFPRGQLADRSRYRAGSDTRGAEPDGCRSQGVQ